MCVMSMCDMCMCDMSMCDMCMCMWFNQVVFLPVISGLGALLQGAMLAILHVCVHVHMHVRICVHIRT